VGRRQGAAAARPVTTAQAAAAPPATAVVRAVHTAARVPGLSAPFDTAHVKVFYPAAPTRDDAERMTGVVAADASSAPYPVVLLLPGINVTPDSYRWLAVALAARGYAVAVYAVVEQVFGAGTAVSPGVDVARITPDGVGSAPSGIALRPVLDAVAALGQAAPLSGLLDLDRVALVGHSAGGAVVLQSARRDWVPGLRAVATYGAHLMAATQLGWPPATFLPVPEPLPVLLAAGEHDGVMAASAVRYGEGDDDRRLDPVQRTWESSVAGGRDDGYLLELRGANHFTVAWPLDPTSARSFLDQPAEGDEDALRAVLAEAFGLFLDAHVREDAAAAQQLEGWLTQPPASVALRRK